MAEEVEKRRLAKGNRVEQNKGRTQGRGTLPRELDRIRQKALSIIKVAARFYPR
jgi:hypothetical protein